MTDSLCTCSTPLRPSGHEPEPLPPWKCLTCGGYACEYAEQGQKKCPPSICDCFIDMYPDSPRDLHPEAFVVRVTPPVGQSAENDAPDRKPLGAPCRYCGSGDTWIEWRLEAQPVGTFSLAGAQMKFSAGRWPYAVCDGCGHVSRGQRDAPIPPGEGAR